MRIETTPTGVVVYHLAGPLVLNTLFDFQSAARANGGAATVVDLSEVPYMDSAGLGAVLGVFASCQRAGRGFAIAGVPERVRTLLRISHVDGLVAAYDTAEDAGRELSKAASA